MMVDGPSGAKPTVLVAEDEAMLRVVAVEVLTDAGYRVLEAGDGNTALKAIQDDANVDLLISDIKMPGLNGYELAEAGMALRPAMKVLLMTGYVQEPIPAKMAAAGVRVLYKPFDIDQLPALADSMLKNRPF
ncbi:MAG: response regulator [Alphaproteobacteria bacterium]